jgi:hypothetical protein
MDKEYIEGGQTMIAEELKVLFDELKGELLLVRNDLLLISYDLAQMRKQLDKFEEAMDNPPPQPMDMTGMRVEKL